MVDGPKNKVAREGPNLAVRIPDDRKEELQILAIKNKTSLQDMVPAGLRLLEQKWAADEGRPSPFTKLGKNPEYYFSDSGVQSDAYRQLHVKLARAIQSGGPDARAAIEACLDKYAGKALHPRQRNPKAQALGPHELVGAADELERDTTAVERNLREMAGGKPGAKGGRGGMGSQGGKRNPPKAG